MYTTCIYMYTYRNKYLYIKYINWISELQEYTIELGHKYYRGLLSEYYRTMTHKKCQISVSTGWNLNLHTSIYMRASALYYMATCKLTSICTYICTDIYGHMQIIIKRLENFYQLQQDWRDEHESMGSPPKP